MQSSAECIPECIPGDDIHGVLESVFKRKRRATMKANYDYLVVGAGLYGAVFAYEAKRREDLSGD